MNVVLIVDDEPSVLSAFQEMLAEEGFEVLIAGNAEQALALAAQQLPDLIVTDICMPGISGLDALQSLRARYPKLPVIVMSGQGTMVTAIEATKRGAFDYVLKPFQPEEMLAIIQRALEGVRIMRRQVVIESADAAVHDHASGDVMIGKGPQMQQVFKAIGRVAGTGASVLIRGESGTGKELVARAIYQHSQRADQPLMVLNCTAIPESLLESELFGHERGAFTGATARRIGKFEQADGGTLFLDEIGDIPLPLQAKILRVLQEMEFQRVGGNDTIHTSVRVIAATNRDLEQAIAAGKFREDLYHRLNVVTITLPPLRERTGEIPPLIEYFVRRYCRELGIGQPFIADDAMRLLTSYHWPGNVRQLQHCIHRTLIFSGGHPIRAEHLHFNGDPADNRGRPAAPAAALAQLIQQFLTDYQGEQAHADLLEAAERMLLEEALRRSGGNQSQAARLLGLARPTFHAKMQKLGL